MAVLTAAKLGERQKQLNLKVRQAAQDAIKLEEINEQDGVDVNTLIKISLAAQYQDITYVLTILKSNDSLYISKVLKKCSFMYKDEYSNYINPDYLQEHIFPTISSKLKNKLLTEISKSNLSSERCQSFFGFCIKLKNKNVAFKFLRNTSVPFKKDMICKQKKIVSEMINSSDSNLEIFVKDSFELATMILENINTCTPFNTILKLSYLFSISNDTYLNWIEKYLSPRKNLFKRLSRDISDSILKKHKMRVLSKPALYLPMLNKKSFIRYTSPNEAKLYVQALLPSTSKDFFRFCNSHSYIINLMTPEEKFSNLKEMFTKQYPDTEFETSEDFYFKQCHVFMTTGEKEAWALHHLESKTEILGPKKEHVWCKFINFEKVFPIMKTHILKTLSSCDRSDILIALIYSTRNQQDIQKLLNYFYERHINEKETVKEDFLEKVHKHLNVFTFEADCWNAYNKILCSMDIYTEQKTGDFSYGIKNVTAVSLIYHLSHQLQLPEVFTKILKNVSINTFYEPYFLNDDQRNVVFQSLLGIYVDEVNVFARESQNFTNIPGEINYRLGSVCKNVLNLLKMHKKAVEDIPQIVMTYYDLFPNDFKNSIFYKQDVPQKPRYYVNKKLLKDDAQLIIQSFDEVNNEMVCRKSVKDIRSFVRTLKTYFSHDIAKGFLELLLKSLQNADSNISETYVQTVIYILFQIAKESHKIKFATDHAPQEIKIKHYQKDMKQIYIQKAICKFACFSRPPLPNKYLTKFIFGDFLKYSYHVFWVNASRLSPSQLLEFVETLLHTPIAVRKQAFNIAFNCFTLENLCKVLSRAWDKSKNVSLRFVLYRKTLEKIIAEEEHGQDELFDTLIHFTETLTDCDLEVLSFIFRGNIPSRFVGRLLQTAWATLNTAPKKSNTQQQMYINIMSSMRSNIGLVNRQWVETIIEEYINSLSVRHQVQGIESDRYDVDNNLRLLIAFINHYKDDKCLELVKKMLTKCIVEWNNIDDPLFATAVRKYTAECIIDPIKYCNSDIINFIIETLEERVKLPERYDVVISLKLAGVVLKTLKIDKHHNEGDCSSPKDIFGYLTVYSKYLVKLVNDLVQNKMFYRSYCNEIANFVKENISFICQHLSYNNSDNALENYLALKLCETKNIFEIHLLAVYLISPGGPENSRDQLADAITNIVNFEDDEITFLLYKRVNYINQSAKRVKYNRE